MRSFKSLFNLDNVLTLHELTLRHPKDSKAQSEQHLVFLQEINVPQTADNIEVKAVCEKTCKPLEAYHVGLELTLFKVRH